MARGHLTRSPSGHLIRQAGRSPDSASGSTFTLADGLADFLVSGRARGLSPKTLDWYRMIGERFAAYRTRRGADPALSAVSVAEGRAFVVSLQESRALAIVGRRLRPRSQGVLGLVRGGGSRRRGSASASAPPAGAVRLIGTLGPVELRATPRGRLAPRSADHRLAPRHRAAAVRAGRSAHRRPAPRRLPPGPRQGRQGAARSPRDRDRGPLPDYLAHSRPRPIGRAVDHVFLARDGRPLTSARSSTPSAGSAGGPGSTACGPTRTRSATRSPSSTCSTAATCSASRRSSATRPSTWFAATSTSTPTRSSANTRRPRRSIGWRSSRGPSPGLETGRPRRANAAEPGEVIAGREALVRGAEVGIEQGDVPLRHLERVRAVAEQPGERQQVAAE